MYKIVIMIVLFDDIIDDIVFLKNVYDNMGVVGKICYLGVLL